MHTPIPRRTLLKNLLLLSGTAAVPSLWTGCGRPETIADTAANQLPEPFATLQQICSALRTSPDHLPARMDRLAKDRDWAGLYTLVRDEILTYPDSDHYAVLGTDAASAVRWGAAATLRGGAGTLREKAEVLVEAYRRAGLEAKIVVWPRELSVAEQRALLFREPEYAFAPEIPRALASKFPDRGRTSAVIDEGGKDSAAWAEKVVAALPEDYAAEAIDLPFVAGTFSLPAVWVKTPEREYYLDLTAIDQDFEAAPTTAPDGVSGEAPTVTYEKLTVQLQAYYSDVPNRAVPWLDYAVGLDEVAGKQFNLNFLSLPLASSLSTSVHDINSFTPVLRIAGEQPTIKPGPAYTRRGDEIVVSGSGDLIVNGQNLGNPDQAGSPPNNLRRLEAKVNTRNYPEIELRVKALDGQGKPVTGMLPAHFALVETGQNRQAVLLTNDLAPKIVILKDNSGSMPSVYFGQAWEDLINSLTETLTEKYPQASLEVREVEDRYFKVLHGVVEEGWSAIICVSDGEITDNFEASYGEAYQQLPPVIFAHTGPKAPAEVTPLAKNVDMTTVAATDHATLRAKLLAVLATVDAPPYTLRYTAEEMAEGTDVEVQLRVGKSVETTVNYRVPALTETIPSRRLCGLALQLTYPGGTHVHRLGGYHPSISGELKNEHLDKVEEVLFGNATIAVEGRRPNESVWLEDIWRSRLTWLPVWKQTQSDGKLSELEDALAGIRTTSERPLLVMAPLPNPVGKNHLTYEQSCQICIIQQTPQFGKHSFKLRCNLLDAANYLTVGPDPATAFRITAANTLRQAVAEQTFYEESTLTGLGNRPLTLLDQVYYSPERYPDLSAARQWAYNRLFGFRGKGYRTYSVGASDAGPLAYLEVDMSTGAVLAILQDGTGGGGEIANLKATLQDLDRAIAAINLMVAASAAFGGLSGASASALGAVAVYGQHLARFYGAAGLAVFNMSTLHLGTRLKAIFARMICDQIKNLAYGMFAPKFANYENVVTSSGGSIPSPCDLVTPKPDFEDPDFEG